MEKIVERQLTGKIMKLSKFLAFLSPISVLLVALATRCLWLAEYPLGLHGDEAWTGIRAHDYLRDGWIGFFDSVHSVGQWALANYFTVPFLLIEDPIVSIRLPMAVLGAFSVLFFYLFLKNTLGEFLAFLGGIILAIFPTHVLLSRVALPPISGFFFISLTLWALTKCSNANNKILWQILAGVFGALALISYGATPAFVGPLLLGVVLFPSSIGKSFKDRFFLGVWLGVGLALVLVPVSFVEWGNGSLFTRGSVALGSEAVFDIDKALGMLKGLLLVDRADGSDGTGATSILDWCTVFLSGVGIIFSLFPLRSAGSRIDESNNEAPIDLRFPLIFTLIVSFALASYASINVGYGLYRRLLPSIALLIWFAAFSIFKSRVGLFRAALSLSFLAGIFFQANKLWASINHPGVKWVYCSDLARASLWAREFKDSGLTLAFSSGRWPGIYETSRYLMQMKEKNWEVIDITTKEQLDELLNSHKKIIGIFFPDRYSLVDQSKFKTCEDMGEFMGCRGF